MAQQCWNFGSYTKATFFRLEIKNQTVLTNSESEDTSTDSLKDFETASCAALPFVMGQDSARLGSRIYNRDGSRLQLQPRHSILKQLAEEQKIGDKRIVPLVTESMHLNCSLDVLLLRRTKPHQLYSEGDLDGKIKTLLDALKKPGPNDNKDGDEDPLYCLMEDDKLLTELKLVGDLLLPAEDQLITVPEDTEEDSENPWKLKLGEQHAVVIIHVKVKVGRATEENTDFL